MPLAPANDGHAGKRRSTDGWQDGRICGRCLDDRLDAFQRRYPGVRLTVIAEDNAYQDGLVLQDTDPARYQELLNG